MKNNAVDCDRSICPHPKFDSREKKAMNMRTRKNPIIVNCIVLKMLFFPSFTDFIRKQNRNTFDSCQLVSNLVPRRFII